MHDWDETGVCKRCKFNNASCSHKYRNCVCMNCGLVCTDHQWRKHEGITAGRCQICYTCLHEYENGKCRYCGGCEHEYKDGYCIKCCGSDCAHKEFRNGICQKCGLRCSHLWAKSYCATCGMCYHFYWENGVCQGCGKKCAHDWKNGACTVCGMSCAHTWENGVCTVCGMDCAHDCAEGVCGICGMTVVLPESEPVEEKPAEKEPDEEKPAEKEPEKPHEKEISVIEKINAGAYTSTFAGTDPETAGEDLTGLMTNAQGEKISCDCGKNGSTIVILSAPDADKGYSLRKLRVSRTLVRAAVKEGFESMKLVIGNRQMEVSVPDMNGILRADDSILGFEFSFDPMTGTVTVKIYTAAGAFVTDSPEATVI